MKSFKAFINESMRVDEGLMKKITSFCGGIGYAFDIEEDNTQDEVNIELSVNKGSDIIEQFEDYEKDLTPDVTYMSIIMAAQENHEFMFDIKEWYNITDFFKGAVNEATKVGSSKFKKDKDSLTVTVQDMVYGKDVTMIFKKEGTSIVWSMKTSVETIKITLPRDLIKAVNKLKFK